ncbi:MAG: hypothetical protein ACKO37_01560 [Vampirovibrionales bacterium]
MMMMLSVAREHMPMRNGVLVCQVPSGLMEKQRLRRKPSTFSAPVDVMPYRNMSSSICIGGGGCGSCSGGGCSGGHIIPP